MDSRNIEQINEALRNSFAAIKQDMLDLRSAINLQAHDTRELKHAYEVMKGESVTSDKLNLVKIRIGELNESLKRIWSIEEQIKSLEDKIVSKAFVNQQVDGVAIKINDLKGKLESFAKSYVSEIQIKKLIEDMNKELNSLRSGIEEVKDVKDTIKQKTLEKVAFRLNNRLEELRSQFNVLSADVRSNIDNLRNSQKSLISESQVKDLITDINDEFDKVKEVIHHNSNAIEQLRESFADTENNFKGSVNRELAQASSRIEYLQGELSGLRTKGSTGTYSAPSQSSKKIKSRKEAMPAPPMDVKHMSVKRPIKKTKWFANFLIAMSFISLLLSLVAFVVDNTSLSDQLGMVAVGAFIVGIFMRFIIALKKKSFDQD